MVVSPPPLSPALALRLAVAPGRRPLPRRRCGALPIRLLQLLGVAAATQRVLQRDQPPLDRATPDDWFIVCMPNFS